MTTMTTIDYLVYPEAHGPDLSHHNPIGNPSLFPRYHVAVAKATEGDSFRSPALKPLWDMFRWAGVPRIGLYHWITPHHSVTLQVHNFTRALESIGLLGPPLPPGVFLVIDWERTAGRGFATVTQVERLTLELHEIGYQDRVAVYSSSWVDGFELWRTRNPNVPLWYANYRRNLTDPQAGQHGCRRYSAAMWQWTSSQQVPGIADPTCDMNHIYRWDVLDRIAGLTTPPPPREEDDGMRQYDYNGMILADTGTDLRRVISGLVASIGPATTKIDRPTLEALIQERRTSGRPFNTPDDPQLVPYVDAALDDLWMLSRAPGNHCPTATDIAAMVREMILGVKVVSHVTTP